MPRHRTPDRELDRSELASRQDRHLESTNLQMRERPSIEKPIRVCSNFQWRAAFSRPFHSRRCRHRYISIPCVSQDCRRKCGLLTVSEVVSNRRVKKPDANAFRLMGN